MFFGEGAGDEYQLTARFHGQSYADGALCPNDCSSHGKCSEGKCACQHNWGGVDCSFAVLTTALGRTYHFDLAETRIVLDFVDGSSQALDVQLLGSGQLALCYLEGPDGRSLVPGSEYWTLCKQLNSSITATEISTSTSRPVYLSCSASHKGTVALYVSASSTSHTDSVPAKDPSKFVILVGTLVPVGFVGLVIFGSVAYWKLCKNGARRQGRITANSSSAQAQREPSKTLVDLDLISSLLLYSTVTVRYSIDCAVCLDSFTPDTAVRQLLCGHVYHSECLSSLAARQQLCCVCKQEFDRKCDVSILTTHGEARDG